MPDGPLAAPRRETLRFFENKSTSSSNRGHVEQTNRPAVAHVVLGGAYQTTPPSEPELGLCRWMSSRMRRRHWDARLQPPFDQSSSGRLVLRPNPMLHFARFLSTPFELYALNPFSLFTYFCANFNVSFSCFEHFRQGVRVEPHVTFRVVFVRPNTTTLKSLKNKLSKTPGGVFRFIIWLVGTKGNFKDVRFFPHVEFWPFLGRPLKDVRVLPHPKFSSIFGPTPLFQLFEALFWPNPTENSGLFWTALLKMSGLTPC